MMERRRFMKGLAATPLALFLAEMGCKQDQPAVPTRSGDIDRAAKLTTNAKKTLNVFVHGTFAIVLDKKQSPAVAVLKAPDVGIHKYEARTFTINPSDPKDLAPGWIYQCPQMGQQDSVSFAAGNSKIPAGIRIGQPDHIAIDVSRRHDGATPHWTVTLPMPDQICGLRATPYNYFSKTYRVAQSLTYKYNGMTPDQRMPLIYVLSYQNIDTNQDVKFNGANDWKIDFGTSGIGRLHLYAEPTVQPPLPPHPGVDPCHVNMAIDRLNLLFNPNLDLQFLDNTCDPTFGVYPDRQLSCTMNNSIVPCDERSLEEIYDNTKCGDLLNKGNLEDQFQAVIALENQFADTLSGLEKQQKRLAKTARRTLPLWYQKKLYAALPNPGGFPTGKPPHNCTSVICLNT
jgi:hypothetical protein